MPLSVTVVLLLLVSLICRGNCRDLDYFIAAVEGTWDYAPSESNLITQDTRGPQIYLSTSNGSIGHVYKKAMFREFTDGTFITEKSRPEYLGFIGPVITANVGDRINIHFKNRASREFSIQPLALTQASEGERGRGVNPGNTRDIVWTVDAASGPREEDPVCITSLYYSNVDMVKDVSSGLVGVMKICRAGTSSETRRKHFIMYLNAVDENKSWYLEDNYDDYGDRDGQGWSKFTERNRKHSINGYIYGNIPPLSVCLNDEVYFHVASLGGKSNDVHSFTVLGHTLIHKNKRVDAVPVYPGVTSTVVVRASEAGSWLFGSRSYEHWKGGMLGLLSVDTCNNSQTTTRSSKTIRRYYIAAERLFEQGRYRTVFKQYTDRRFNLLKHRSDIEGYLENLGPLITANQGDTIKVVFYNKGTKSYSIYPRGVRMTKHYEGIFYNDSVSVTRSVLPGRKKTYYWTVPESFAPRGNDSMCRMTYYTSEGNVSKDSGDGLVGPILICKEGTLYESGYPVGEARDVFLIYTESEASDGPKYYVNGVQTLPAVKVCRNEEIDLHLLYIGNTEPFISLHFDEDPVLLDGTRRTTIGISSYIQETVTFTAKSRGEIKMNENILRVQYNNEGCSVAEQDDSIYPLGDTYYFAIQEQTWNYGGRKISREEWLRLYPGSIGPSYKKVTYKRFYSQYFAYPYDSTSSFFGPLIKVTVGSSIKIVLGNKVEFPFTLKADGIIIEVENGADNETVVRQDEKITFIWKFPESSGPADGDPQCIMRIYYSNINKSRDVGSGLVGPLLICKDSSTTDTHSVLFIGGTDETQSWFIDENLNGKTANKDDKIYRKGNNIYAINGYAAGTFPDMDQIIPQSERYLHIANIDTVFHSFHLNGNYFNDTHFSGGPNVIGMYPWTTSTVKVKMQNNGLWTLQGLGNEDQMHNLYGTYFVGTKIAAPEK